MKPTLNEEIGMSQEGIGYVNSLEVKEPKFEKPLIKLNIETHYLYYEKISASEILERQRIKRQGRNALICVLIIIAITFITNYFNK
ncbi:hypothetical protein D3C87_1903080 [compost metagenome]